MDFSLATSVIAYDRNGHHEMSHLPVPITSVCVLGVGWGGICTHPLSQQHVRHLDVLFLKPKPEVPRCVAGLDALVGLCHVQCFSTSRRTYVNLETDSERALSPADRLLLTYSSLLHIDSR